MRIFVTGAAGQLGHDVIRTGAARGHEMTGSDIREVYATAKADPSIAGMKYVRLDITDRERVTDTVTELKPEAIIHCAAWTAVDAAEEPDNQEKVDRINHLGTGYLAEAAKTVDAKMIYLSTDYVFDGSGTRPWEPDDQCYAPVNFYGQSKLNGEMAVRESLEKFFIVRTAWVFGLNGKNFISTMINIGKKQRAVRVVDDQIGTPTYTLDLAGLLLDMAATEKYGCYHVTNSESEPGQFISRNDFCREIYRQYGLDTKVIPVSTEEYGLCKAARPKNSRLDKSKLFTEGFRPLPDWKDAVSRYLKEAAL